MRGDQVIAILGVITLSVAGGFMRGQETPAGAVGPPFCGLTDFLAAGNE